MRDGQLVVTLKLCWSRSNGFRIVDESFGGERLVKDLQVDPWKLFAACPISPVNSGHTKRVSTC